MVSNFLFGFRNMHTHTYTKSDCARDVTVIYINVANFFSKKNCQECVAPNLVAILYYHSRYFFKIPKASN